MKGFFLFCVLTMLLCNGKADDLILKSGKIYKNFKVHNVNTSGPVIMYENGMATIPFADLPDDLRAKYAEQEKQFSARSKAQSQEQQKQPGTPTGKTGNSGNSVSKSGGYVKSSGNYGGSKTIHVGPRGGRYYINSHGKKTYIRRKK